MVTVQGGPIASLSPGASDSSTFTATYTITQADINNGSFTNSATANANSPAGPVSDVSDDPTNPNPGPSDPTITGLPQNPEISITKEANVPANATIGDDIVYTIIVSNTGNVTITNIDVSDSNAVPANFSIPSLDPGQSVTFTAIHTITLADMNNGSVSNTATASGDDPTGNPVTGTSDDPTTIDPLDPTVTTLNQVAELTTHLDDNDPSSPTNPSTYFSGDNINYTLLVENTGNVSISNVLPPSGYTSVMSGGVNIGDTNGDGVLDPGEVWQYTGSHTLTQSEIDAGSYTSQVDVNGEDPNGNNVNDTSNDPQTTPDNDPTTTYFDLTSEISIDKVDTLPGTVAVGEDITYTITVHNNGNTTLSNVTVTDPNATNLTYVGGDSNGNNMLEPSETWTYTAIHTITQSDMDAGEVINQASVSSNNPSGDPVEDEDSDDTDTGEPDDPTVTDLHSYQDPDLETIKTVLNYTDNGLSGDSAGDVITYEITVENTGNVTLSNISISDNLITNAGGTVNYVSGDLDSDGLLDVGETWVYHADYTVTQSDIDFGRVSNTAVAHGTDTNGNPVSDVSDSNPGLGTPEDPTVTTFVQNPQLEVTKVDVLPSNVAVGEYITYTIVVTNTGNVTLSNINVTDTNATMNGVGSSPLLLPGDSVTFTAVHLITQEDMDNGFVDNQATAGAEDPNGNTVEDLSDDTDDATDQDTEGDGEPDDITHTDLSPYQQTGIAVTLDDNVQTTPSNPFNYNVGDIINYTAELTNTGNVSVVPTTPAGYTPVEQGGFNVGDTDQDGELDPGETWVYTTTHTVTQSDIDAGQVIDQVTFNGTAVNGSSVSDLSDDPQDPTTTTDDETITYIAQTPALSVTKVGTFNDANGNGLADVGEVITYDIVVTNTGNVTISNIAVTDPNATITGGSPITSLAPGASSTVTAEHVLTQSDIDAGHVENQASAEGDDPSGDPVSAISDDPSTLPTNDPTITGLPVHAELQMTKTGEFTDANGDGYAQPGELITYTFEVSNAGNQTISNVSIDDSFLTAPGATYVSGDTNANNMLDVGEVWIFTGVHALTQSDIDAGEVDNQATVMGEDPAGNTLTDLSDDPNDPTDYDDEGDNEPDDITTTDVPQHPELSLLKEGHFNDENGNGLADVGETISYTFTVTNVGNVTLTDIMVDDALPGIVVSGSPIILAPGDSDNTTFTAVYTITKSDIDNGSVVNSAVVTGEDPQGDPVSDVSDDPSDSTDVDPNGDGNPDDPTVIETLGLVITTIFTPNGDGVNDVWALPGIANFKHNTVKIYNRWGNIVYEADHYIGDWDGHSNGRMTVSAEKLLPIGTYFYVIDLGTGHEPFTGYLYLNR
jgi:gliding motility-associated-like protein/uncharacterized repeat protein (TIGR01451 family)